MRVQIYKHFCTFVRNNFTRTMKIIQSHKSHPWHGIPLGDNAPEEVTAFIEIVPTDTVKYEVDKVSGYLTIDRPQKFSNIVPALYGFLPRTLCSTNMAARTMEVLGRDDIKGDGDPLDICVLTEKDVTHGDIVVKAIPIGGIRLLDHNEADDKIISVLRNDAIYSQYKDITDLPEAITNRIIHYFTTYKDIPGVGKQRMFFEGLYGREEAYEVIRRSAQDYDVEVWGKNLLIR